VLDLDLKLLVGHQVRFVTWSGAWGDGELLHVDEAFLVISTYPNQRTWIDRSRLESMGVHSVADAEDLTPLFDEMPGAGCRSVDERRAAERKAGLMVEREA
jgi:hypothetical protein